MVQSCSSHLKLIKTENQNNDNNKQTKFMLRIIPFALLVLLGHHATFASPHPESGTLTGGSSSTNSKSSKSKKPNILFLLVDDWGAGDIDVCPDHIPLKDCPFRPTSKARRSVLNTPRMKQMAQEGMIMSNFYSPRAICTPSRAGMLTGRDPTRYALIDNVNRIIQGSSSRGGLTPEEKSFAKYLKQYGNYTTGYSGKWHAGMGDGIDPYAYTPMNHGFDDTFFFLEGSNGETCLHGALNPAGDDNSYHMCSFDHIQNCNATTRSCEVVEQPIRWENVTARHVKASLDFIEDHAEDDEPWMLMHSFTLLHVPWVPSRFFVTDPFQKFWTDTVGEVDWAVGVFLQKLKDLGIDENTLVVLTSDNGPNVEHASNFCPQNCRWQKPSDAKDGIPDLMGCTPCDANSVSLPGPMKGGKGNSWEGGQKVPSLWWWPGHIEAGTINPVVSSGLDLLPTFVSLADGKLDEGVEYDGRDLSEHILQTRPDPASDPEGSFVYWCGNTLMAVRVGRYKVMWRTQNFTTGNSPKDATPPYMCAGTGNCCPDSPARLCMCDYATRHPIDAPVVVDLVENVNEDLSLALDNSDPYVQEAIQKATAIMEERLVSEALDHGGISVLNKNITTIWNQLSRANSYSLVDYSNKLGEVIPRCYFCEDEYHCIGDVKECLNEQTKEACLLKPGQGSKILAPEACQNEKLPGAPKPFAPYESCSITEQQNASCANRLPCGKQEGYMGPFEYMQPNGDTWHGKYGEPDVHVCGIFDNGNKKDPRGVNSYWPEYDIKLAQSVCDWWRDATTDLVDLGLPVAYNSTRCQLPQCIDQTDPDAVAANLENCKTIKKYGLDSVSGTGFIFNSPYPDTQDDIALRYPNQNVYPPWDEEYKVAKALRGGKVPKYM